MKYIIQRFGRCLWLPVIFMSVSVISLAKQTWELPCPTWQPSSDVSQEKPMVVIIPSFNNAKWYRHNLDSVLAQKYTNFRVVYIDDCSPDRTGQLVKEYVKEKGWGSRVRVICNKSRSYALANLYKAIHECDDHEIVVSLDGDDWFAHYDVLKIVNEAYQDPNVWLTYGQYEPTQSYFQGRASQVPNYVIKQNTYREYGYVTSALRTFYAGLFKQVKLQDLLWEGDFYHSVWDVAMMYPMLEMSGGKSKFISHILYIYNIDTPINDFKGDTSIQYKIGTGMQKMRKYTAIENFDSVDDTTVDLCILSQSPERLVSLLQSVERFVSGVNSVHVLFDPCNEKVRGEFSTIASRFPQVQFASRVSDTFEHVSSRYLALVVDTKPINSSLHFESCATLMNQTKAYTCFIDPKCNMITPLPKHTHVNDNFYAFVLESLPQDINMTLYHTADVVQMVKVHTQKSSMGRGGFETLFSSHDVKGKVALFSK